MHILFRVGSCTEGYVRARAEGLGLIGETGVAHRVVRLKIICVGVLLGGSGVPYGLEIVL
jgi:CDP-diacylglycerol---glycerol-3-phosphate 3-phosphatidyltransferase